MTAAMRFFHVLYEDGTQSHRHSDDDWDIYALIMSGAQEMPRMPEDYEHWDRELRDFVQNSDFDAVMHAEIDDGFGVLISKFITVQPGMDGIYAMQAAEAKALQAGLEGPFPMLEDLAAAAGGVELAVVAAPIAAKAAYWIKIAARANAARLAAKAAVTAAGSLAEKRAAAQIDWKAVVAPLVNPKDQGGEAVAAAAAAEPLKPAR